MIKYNHQLFNENYILNIVSVLLITRGSMKNIFVIMLSLFCVSVHAENSSLSKDNNNKITDLLMGNSINLSDIPRAAHEKCLFVIKNENSTFYDCGNYVLSYTKKDNRNDSNTQYYKYCQKKEDGSLGACAYF